MEYIILTLQITIAIILSKYWMIWDKRIFNYVKYRYKKYKIKRGHKKNANRTSQEIQAEVLKNTNLIKNV